MPYTFSTIKGVFMVSIRSVSRRGFLGPRRRAHHTRRRRPSGGNAPRPSGTVSMGFIGVGGRATQLLPVFMALAGVRVLAVCDVNRERRERAKTTVDAFYGNADCAAYRDFRELLARPDIDALYIATGDRWHAQLAIHAMRAGKDVYCEKPISLSMREGEAVVAAATRYQRIYQGGVQRRNVGNFVTAMELAKSGSAAWGLAAYDNTLHAGMAGMGRSASNHFLPAEPDPAAEDFDWNMARAHALASVQRGLHQKVARRVRLPRRLTEWGSHTLDLCCSCWDARTRPLSATRLWTSSRCTPPTPTASSWSCAKGLQKLLRRALRRRGGLGRNRRLGRPLLSVVCPAREPQSPVRKLDAPGRPSRRVHRLRLLAPDDLRAARLAALHARGLPCRHNRLPPQPELTFDPATLAFANDVEANRLINRPCRAPWHL